MKPEGVPTLPSPAYQSLPACYSEPAQRVAIPLYLPGWGVPSPMERSSCRFMLLVRQCVLLSMACLNRGLIVHCVSPLTVIFRWRCCQVTNNPYLISLMKEFCKRMIHTHLRCSNREAKWRASLYWRADESSAVASLFPGLFICWISEWWVHMLMYL